MFTECQAKQKHPSLSAYVTKDYPWKVSFDFVDAVRGAVEPIVLLIPNRPIKTRLAIMACCGVSNSAGRPCRTPIAPTRTANQRVFEYKKCFICLIR